MRHLLVARYPSMLVTLDGKLLKPKKDGARYNEISGGFNWGYEGPGPNRLALAVLLEIHNSTLGAYARYRAFAREVVGRMPQFTSCSVEFDDATYSHCVITELSEA